MFGTFGTDSAEGTWKEIEWIMTCGVSFSQHVFIKAFNIVIILHGKDLNVSRWKMNIQAKIAIGALTEVLLEALGPFWYDCECHLTAKWVKHHEWQVFYSVHRVCLDMLTGSFKLLRSIMTGLGCLYSSMDKVFSSYCSVNYIMIGFLWCKPK